MKARPARRPVSRKPKAHGPVPVRPAGAEVKITPAKGRPMLTWVGKRPLSYVTAFPAQPIETFDPGGALSRPSANPDLWKDWPVSYPQGGLLFHGDNKEVIAHLLANGFRGRVHLIYIDPPFDSGADYVRRVSLRGVSGTTKVDGEEYTLGEQIQYHDIWAKDNYLQFMYERLLLLKELLTEVGSIYVHADWRQNAHLRSLMDEVFGAENFQNEIIWQRTSARSDSAVYNHIHDTILFYTKSDVFTWHEQFTAYSEGYVDQFYRHVEEGSGRRFTLSDLMAAGLRSGSSGRPWRGIDPAARGNHWKYTLEKLEELDRQGRIYWPKDGGVPRYKRYLDEMPGKPLQSIWTDLGAVAAHAKERLDFPTQKPEALLERIVVASSNPGDIVLDCFIGSGTTASVAQRLGRRWIGCDINQGAIQTTSKSLQTLISDQITANPSDGAQGQLIEIPKGRAAKNLGPAQLAFTVWRVNDYDLAIQHNEAVNLACEHIGVQRTRTDTYFDGTLGKSLVKIVPFDHPLSPVDLEELRRELDARPDEDRVITLVCLGIELAAHAWIEEWNRLRKGKDAINRIDVIELRTDPKYGRFIKHEPARAKVKIARRKDKIIVEIEDFISPTIIERLQQQAGILSPKIDDWRAMVDAVMIDPSYNGQVFNVALSDVPERKSDFVAGRYELPAPDREATVAVKIRDMLGEEVLVTATA